MRHWRAAVGGLFIAAIAIALMGCAAQPRIVPVPELPGGPIELRVAHVVNPRLPRMDAAQLRALLDEEGMHPELRAFAAC